ncbi:MAG TPA: hypothetical protein VFJ06_14180 [Halococcus sp.]|nr:hypothetical protein [Halococcus sp.]
MNDHETADLTPAMLEGTPVGGPDGFAACDTCNRSLTDGHREHDPDNKEADTVFAYATCAPGTNKWALRWVSCEECGPPGDGEADEPGEAIAKAMLAYDGRIDAFALADPKLPTNNEPNAVLYYLPFGTDRTRDLRHRIGRESAVPTLAEFVACYERVGEDHADDLRDLWQRWNRGSGNESQAFTDAECRSLSVADVVVFDESAYLCAPIGWRPLELRERDREAD